MIYIFWNSLFTSINFNESVSKRVFFFSVRSFVETNRTEVEPGTLNRIWDTTAGKLRVIMVRV